MYMSGSIVLNPSTMYMKALMPLYYGLLNDGNIVIAKEKAQDDVISPRNMFLSTNTSLHANGYQIAGKVLPAIRILMPP